MLTAMPAAPVDILLYVFVAACSLQLLGWVILLAGMLKIKPAARAAQAPPPLSIVVAARNELTNLQELVPALLAQDHPDFEVIIVNDRSADGTHEWLRQQTEAHPRLRMVQVEHLPDHINGKKYALTLGIKAARHRQVLLTDADCRPVSAHWAALMADGFRGATDIVLGYSHYAKRPGWLNYFIRFETLLTGIQYLGAAALGRPYMGVGRNLAYKKDLFLENKGFNGIQHLTGGDDDLLINRLATGRNTRVVVGPAALTLSQPKTTWHSWWQQKLRHLHVGRYYRPGTRLLIGLFMLSWVLTWWTGILAVALGGWPTFIIAGLAGRQMAVWVVFALAGQRLGVRQGWPGIIFADMFYTFYYIFAGIRALFIKNIAWG